MKKKTKIIISIIVLFFALLFLGASIFVYMLSPVTDKDVDVTFVAVEGSSTRELLNKLEDEGLIKSSEVALIYMKLNSSLTIKAGTYNFSKNLSTTEIIKLLDAGHTVEKEGLKVTFIEGKRLVDYVKVISEKFPYTEEAILETINNKEYLNKLIDKYWFLTEEILNKDIYYPLEGYLYPDTYLFKIDSSIEEIIGKMLDTLNNRLSPYQEIISEGDLTVHQILSLASDVEKEGNTTEDRKLIAGVFLNRLENGMSLGSDVTTYYAFKVVMGERDLYQKELNTENPYNTRGPNMIGKINIGPICSPSLSSIKAVIEPTDNDYFYFYADYKGDGKVYYSKTLKEHGETVSRFEN